MVLKSRQSYTFFISTQNISPISFKNLVISLIDAASLILPQGELTVVAHPVCAG